MFTKFPLDPPCDPDPDPELELPCDPVVDEEIVVEAVLLLLVVEEIGADWEAGTTIGATVVPWESEETGPTWLAGITIGVTEVELLVGANTGPEVDAPENCPGLNPKFPPCPDP